MSADQDYTGRHRHDDGPRADTTMVALYDALGPLRTAALVAETSEAHRADGLLADAALIAFGFAPDSDEAKGLHLLIGSIQRAKEAAS
jgi:hypothetical protein